MPINFVSAQAPNVTTITTVYSPTTAGVQATLSGCLIANTTLATVIASVTLTNASSTSTTNIVKDVVIPTGTALDIMNSAKINVPEDYTLKVVASGAVDVTVSATEVT